MDHLAFVQSSVGIFHGAKTHCLAVHPVQRNSFVGVPVGIVTATFGLEQQQNNRNRLHQPVCTATSPRPVGRVRRAQNSQETLYDFGVHVHMKDVKQIPITVEQFWSGFDDYLSIQKVLGLHDNTERVPGTPDNGAGAQIVFDYLGGKTYER